jgi:hypothetical protein
VKQILTVGTYRRAVVVATPGNISWCGEMKDKKQNRTKQRKENYLWRNERRQERKGNVFCLVGEVVARRCVGQCGGTMGRWRRDQGIDGNGVFVGWDGSIG